MKIFLFSTLILLILSLERSSSSVVVSTWDFKDACQVAWDVLSADGDAIDAIETGCSQCETDRCGNSVGYGNHPDENGEVTLEAMIMDG